MSAILNNCHKHEKTIVSAYKNHDSAPLLALLTAGVSQEIIKRTCRKHHLSDTALTREVSAWACLSQEEKTRVFTKKLLQISDNAKSVSLLSSYLTAREPQDNSALIIEMIKQDNADMLKLLVPTERVDVPILNENAPLHLSCRYRAKKCTAYLLEAEADLNLAGHQQMTPLHYSLLACDLETARELTFSGADITKRDLNDEPPYALPLRLGNRRVTATILNKWPRVAQEFKKCGNLDLLKSRVKLNSKTYLEGADPRLELPYLFQDAEWMQVVAAKMPPNEYKNECQKLQEMYPGSHFSLLEDARLSLNPVHIVELGTLERKTLPDRSLLEETNLKELLSLFDRINLNLPDRPGYRNPARIKDSNGRTYSPEQLKNKLKTLILNITQRTPNAGIPSVDQTKVLETLRSIRKGLPKEKIPLCMDTFDSLEHYFTPGISSPPPLPLLERLEEMLTPKELEPLQPLIPQIKVFETWYRQLEDTVKAILIEIKKEPFENAVPTLLELALAGGNCGGWIMGDALAIHQQKKGEVNDFRTQVLLVINTFYQGLLQSFLDLGNDQNRHERTKIQSEIELYFGITEKESETRVHFQDPLSNYTRSLPELTESFKKYYTPTRIIEEVQEALNQEKPAIDRELLVDWAKQHIPEEWNQGSEIPEDERTHSYLGQEVFDLDTGKIRRSFLIFMLFKLKILYYY